MSDKKKDSEVTDVESTDTKGARRRILRTLLAGGSVGATAAFVPTTWTKPVVDAVTLPAHAQTSGAAFSGSGVVGGPLVNLDRPEESSFGEFVQSVRDMVIPTAEAGGRGAPLGSCLSINVANLGDNNSPANVMVDSQIFGPSSGSGTLGQLRGGGITTGAGQTVVANQLNPNGTGNGTVNGVPFNLTPGQCNPVDGEGINGGFG